MMRIKSESISPGGDRWWVEVFIIDRCFISHKTCRRRRSRAFTRRHNYERIRKYSGIGSPWLSIDLTQTAAPSWSFFVTLIVSRTSSKINRVSQQVPRSGQSYYSFDSITLQLQRQLRRKTERLDSHQTRCIGRCLLPSNFVPSKAYYFTWILIPR